MPISRCICCRANFDWRWEEAFDKYGFTDGAQPETWTVVAALERAGYVVKAEDHPLHNTTISSILTDGRELMPEDGSDFNVGHDDTRAYLPQELIEVLDRALP